MMRYKNVKGLFLLGRKIMSVCPNGKFGMTTTWEISTSLYSGLMLKLKYGGHV